MTSLTPALPCARCPSTQLTQLSGQTSVLRQRIGDLVFGNDGLRLFSLFFFTVLTGTGLCSRRRYAGHGRWAPMHCVRFFMCRRRRVGISAGPPLLPSSKVPFSRTICTNARPIVPLIHSSGGRPVQAEPQRTAQGVGLSQGVCSRGDMWLNATEDPCRLCTSLLVEL